MRVQIIIEKGRIYIDAQDLTLFLHKEAEREGTTIDGVVKSMEKLIADNETTILLGT